IHFASFLLDYILMEWVFKQTNEIKDLACATIKRNGSCLCRVYVFPFGLISIEMWTAFSSVLCFLADHSSWILGLYIVSLLLRLGRMGMLLRGVWYFLVYGLFLLDFIRYDSSKKICAATFVS
ncbi:unnamed protein product, partial [Prunus brigantina]